VKAIIFDWDGTLIDTLGALYMANVEVMAALGLPFDEVRYRHHFAPDWKLMYRRLGVPEERLDEANDRWLAAYANGGASALFPGVDNALQRLANAGYLLGLVTAGDRAVVEPQLERFGLTGRFAVSVFGDEVSAHKPDPGPLRAALADLRIADQADHVAYLGDVPDDMRMARAVGVHAVGIVSALGEEADLLAAGADEVVASAVEWIDTFLGGSRQPATKPGTVPRASVG
jgi:phosphoglycolate phosphatase